MDSEQPYKTSDQGFAAYLMLRGFYCAGTVATNVPGKLELIFVDVPSPGDLEDSYFRYKPEKMSAYEFYTKLRTVKHIIHSVKQ